MSESIVNGSIRNSMAGRNHKEAATQSLSRQGGRDFLFFSDFPCKRKSLNASALYIGKLPACFRYCTYGRKKRRNPAKNKRGGPPIFWSVILHNPQAQPQLLMKTTASVTQKKGWCSHPFSAALFSAFRSFYPPRSRWPAREFPRPATSSQTSLHRALRTAYSPGSPCPACRA